MLLCTNIRPKQPSFDCRALSVYPLPPLQLCIALLETREKSNENFGAFESVKGVQRVRVKKEKEPRRNDSVFIWVEPAVRPSLQAINETRGWAKS